MKTHTFISSLFATFTISASALNLPPLPSGVWPESPQAKQIREVTMPAPALSTGASTFSVPLYELDVEGIKIPLTLSYRSNGIRLDDNPFPIGHGWTFSPPLRVCRQIVGRPDERFQFVGDAFGDEYMTAFGTITISEDANIKRYDSERDIFTIYLLDKTLTVIRNGEEFIGVACSEYRITGDEQLSYIKVTDPRGLIYCFNLQSDFCGDESYPTAWMLTSLKLPSGREIAFEWEIASSGYGTANFGPKTIIYSSVDQFDIDETNPEDNALPGIAFSTARNLSKINFPGGSIVLSYASPSGTIGDYLKKIEILANDKTVRSIELARDIDRDDLLGSVTIQGEGVYKFEYEPGQWSQTGIGMDWWGFYNGKTSRGAIVHPNFNVPNEDKADPYLFAIYDGADRSIDENFMKYKILCKATYPTGGTVEWEYETHRFPPQKSEKDWVVRRIIEPTLEYGGGLRVKKMTMKSSANDQSPIVRTYTYGINDNGLAVIETAPLLHTFMTHYHMVWALLESLSLGISKYGIFDDNVLLVNPHSDYMQGHIGEVPIWYSDVCEHHSEGFVRYHFDKLIPNNSVGREWGVVYPIEMTTIFSTGLVLTKTDVYCITDGKERLVERKIEDYELQTDYEHTPHNVRVIRRRGTNAVWLYDPDMGPTESAQPCWAPWLGGAPIVYLPPMNRKDYHWFDIKPYNMVLQAEKHLGSSTTVFTENGKYRRLQRIYYKKDSRIVSQTSYGDGSDSIVTVYTYPDNKSGNMQSLMVARNVIIQPLAVTERHGNISQGYRLEMANPNGSIFKPYKIWRWAGGEEWCTEKYAYDSYGCIESAVNLFDNTDISFRWDSFGRYPVEKTINYKTYKATWKPLVGLESVTDPSGQKMRYYYDAVGRLSQITRGDLYSIEQYSYRINHDGDNRITRKITTDNGSCDVIERYDGLGRNYATFSTVPEGYLATLTEYDNMGRRSKRWNAAPLSGVDVADADISASAISAYGDNYAYEESTYETSPRGITLSSTKPGNLWHENGKSIVSTILTNDASAHSCLRYSVDAYGVYCHGKYQTGRLKVETTIDEDGVVTETYTDYRGLLICRKVGGEATDYVYDDYGRLRYVLPPGLEGTRKLTDTKMEQLAYYYGYDERGRLVLKKMPGTQTISYYYDPADRLVAERNPAFSKGSRIYGYDRFRRQIMAAEVSLSATECAQFAAECRETTVAADWNEVLAKEIVIARFFPKWTSMPEVAWAKFYDSYGFIETFALPIEFKFKYPYSTGGEETLTYTNPEGQLTGMYTGQGFEAYYYNWHRQLWQSFGTGFNSGRTTYEYNHAGQPTKITLQDNNYRRISEYSYDSAMRLIKTTIIDCRNPNDETPIENTAIIATDYDALGRPSKRLLGNNAIVKTNFDIHGWPTRIEAACTDNNLSFMYGYGQQGGAGSFNGNISASIIRTNYNKERFTFGTQYTYDSSNRLTSAKSLCTNRSKINYSTKYEYDERGNILSLTRKGRTSKVGTGYGTLDSIVATYKGNQPEIISNTYSGLLYEGRPGLGDVEYIQRRYDNAGRLCSDDGAGIVSIRYNSDSHPIRTVFTQGHTQEELWDAVGNHIGTIFNTRNSTLVDGSLDADPTTTSFREYRGDGRTFDNHRLWMARFDGGYFDHSGKAHYYITDRQGNNIGVVDADGKLVQICFYYPYGEPWEYPDGQQFLFSDKELIRTHGLHQYEMGARRFYPAFPSFTTPDPLCENSYDVSPYSYCHGNPINKSDRTGLTDFIDDVGNHVWHNDGQNRVFEIDATMLAELQSPSFDYQSGRYTQILASGTPREDVFYTIQNVLSGKPFIGWYPDANCFNLAKEQNNVEVLNSAYRIDYSKHTRDKITSYLKSELSRGHSIMTGVNEGGGPTGNTNKDTQHFINIVGMGYEQGSNYFEYYDNRTSSEIDGTNTTDNRLYFDPVKNSYIDINISQGGGLNNLPFYKITEVRKNKK